MRMIEAVLQRYSCEIFVVWVDMLHTLGRKTNKCCWRHSHLQFRGDDIFIEVVISTADYPIVVISHRG
jgi:hypothetical protein